MSLRRISQAELGTSPVLIVGEARSGTSILYRALQKHEAFRPRRTNLWESHLMRHIGQAASFGPGQPRSMFGYMADSAEHYDAFLDSIGSLRPLLRLGETTLRIAGGHRRGMGKVWAATGHPHVVRSYFHHARHARGVERILEKTPGHIMHVGRLLRCYPDARLIYIHRHPVDVYSSYVRRAQLDPGTRDWAEMSWRAFADRWKRNSKLALSAARRWPGSLLLIAYEEFTRDPESEMRRICGFVGEPYDPELVIERQPDYERRKADPHLFGHITTKTKDWADYLSAEDAAALQHRLRHVMAELSYQPYLT
jgi:hypothetical protein